MDRSGVSAYNDEHTHWPWFVQFLGGAVFFGNEWPPLRARLIVDDRAHPVTKHLAATLDRKSTRLNSSHVAISYADFCLKKKNKNQRIRYRTNTQPIQNHPPIR